jgi:hypothetical protein
MIRNSRTGFSIPDGGKRRPSKTGFAASSRKRIYFFFLAISAMAIACRSFAQENNGSPDGLYAVPVVGQPAATAPESTNDRSAKSYLNSLDPQAQRFQRDMEAVDAADKKAKAAWKLKALTDGNDSFGTGWNLNLSEQSWIAILVGAGLVGSLAAAGYVWWSRSRLSQATRDDFLALRRQAAAPPADAEKHDKTPRRRAA